MAAGIAAMKSSSFSGILKRAGDQVDHFRKNRVIREDRIKSAHLSDLAMIEYLLIDLAHHLILLALRFFLFFYVSSWTHQSSQPFCLIKTLKYDL